MLKKIFRKAHGERFIDIYGWKHGSGTLKELVPTLLATTDMRVACVLCTVGATTDLVTGSGNAGWTMVSGIMFSFYATGIAFKVTNMMVDRFTARDIRTVADYAIDTEGKSPPPENIDLLFNQLRSLRKAQTAFLIVGGSMMGLIMHSSLAEVMHNIASGHMPSGEKLINSMLVAMPIINSTETLVRINKLLKGDYVFCGKPPEKREKAPATQAVSPSIAVPAPTRLSL